MKECKYCRTMYADNLLVCPNCGGNKIVTAREKEEEDALERKEKENRENVITAPLKMRKNILMGIGIMVGMVLLLIVIASVNESKPYSDGTTKDEAETLLENGKNYFDSGEYEAAIDCFAQLPTDSKEYEEAQTMIEKSAESYRKNILSKVEAYVQNEDFEVAIGMLEKALKVLPSDTALKEKYNEIKGLHKKDVINNALSVAKEYAGNSDYPTAIKVLQDAITKMGVDEELEALLESYKSCYRNQLILKAESAFNSSGCDEAIEVLNQGLTLLISDSQIEEKIIYYEEQKPTLLYDLDYFMQTESANLDLVSTITDNLGNVQTNVMIGYNYAGWNGFSSFCETTYKLNGKYKKISGTLFLSYDCRSSEYEPEIQIWCDDKKVAEYIVGRGVEPVDFEVDLTGVNELLVAIRDTAGHSESDYGGVANLYLWK